MQKEPRQATRKDLAAVEAIVRRAYSPFVSLIGRPPGPMLDDFAKLIEAGRVVVVEREGAVRGVLVLVPEPEPEPEAMLLDNVAIDPASQGLGLGRRLLAYAEHAARAAGYRTIRLYTNEVMVENVVLYGRLGYVETHRAEENGFRRVYMVKTLDEPARSVPTWIATAANS